MTCLLGRDIQEIMYSGVADDMSVRKIDLADVTEEEDGVRPLACTFAFRYAAIRRKLPDL